jgi:GntR family negative regulator for fad regulon and positive regulator of fabA
MDYAAFDWRLQSMMAKRSGNMIYPLILNDFAPVFKALGGSYFMLEEGRTASSGYYARLIQAIHHKSDIESIVRGAMEESLRIWEQFQPNRGKHQS